MRPARRKAGGTHRPWSRDAAGAGESGHPALDRREPPAETGHQPRGSLRHARPPSDGEDRGQHVLEAVRIERDDLGRAAETTRTSPSVRPAGQRATILDAAGSNTAALDAGTRWSGWWRWT